MKYEDMWEIAEPDFVPVGPGAGGAADAAEKQSGDSRFGGQVEAHAAVSVSARDSSQKLGNIGLGDVEQLYKTAFGRELDEKQAANLYKMATMLELKKDDGIWLILLALENYQRLYLEAPWNIVTAVRQVIQEVKDETAAATVRAVAEQKNTIAKMAQKQKGKTSKLVIFCMTIMCTTSIVTLVFVSFLIKFNILTYTQTKTSSSVFAAILGMFSN